MRTESAIRRLRIYEREITEECENNQMNIAKYLTPTRVFIGAIIIIAFSVWGIAYLLSGSGDNGSAANEDSFFRRLFPFGTSLIPGSESTDSEQKTDTALPQVPRLRKVAEGPVTGAMFSSSSSTTILRYMERSSGHAYEIDATSPTATRISNTTLPGMYELLPLTQTAFVLRYPNDTGDIENYFASLATGTPNQQLSGRLLPRFDRAVRTNNGSSIFHIDTSANGSVAKIYDLSKNTDTSLYGSPFRSWLPLSEGSRVYIETAPASGLPGFLYEITKGSLFKILGDIPGLVSLPSPDGRYILYSSTSDLDTSLAVLDTRTGITTSSPLKTIASKCAWISEDDARVVCGIPRFLGGGTVLNEWLLGKIHFADSLWILSPLNGTAEAAGNFESLDEASVDMENVIVSDDKEWAAFMNKSDLSLWLLKL